MTSEQKLQQECVVWHRNTRQAGRVIQIKNETNKGAFYASLGLAPGACDLLWLNEGRYYGIELKTYGSQHDVKHVARQAAWIDACNEDGAIASFVFTLEQFKEFILTKGKCALVQRNREVISEKIKKAINKNSKTFRV